MTEIHTSHDVLVLGDRDTLDRGDMLAEKAAEQGAVIIQTYAFDPGEAAAQDDLTEIDAVVAALSRAIATNADIWLPFPLQDLCREQHFRRLSLALQRHGLNLLMGPELAPSPTEGGYSAVDAALREEVRAVDQLDFAALAAAGVRTLGIEIEMALGLNAEQRREIPQEPPFDGQFEETEETEAAYFSTAEVAAFFAESPEWISRGLRRRAFAYPDGAPVLPLQTGRGSRRRFTVAMVRAIAWSCYRQGDLSKQQLQSVLLDLSRWG